VRLHEDIAFKLQEVRQLEDALAEAERQLENMLAEMNRMDLVALADETCVESA
jgi:hypothetical protein